MKSSDIKCKYRQNIRTKKNILIQHKSSKSKTQLKIIQLLLIWLFLGFLVCFRGAIRLFQGAIRQLLGGRGQLGCFQGYQVLLGFWFAFRGNQAVSRGDQVLLDFQCFQGCWVTFSFVSLISIKIHHYILKKDHFKKIIPSKIKDNLKFSKLRTS